MLDQGYMKKTENFNWDIIFLFPSLKEEEKKGERFHRGNKKETSVLYVHRKWRQQDTIWVLYSLFFSRQIYPIYFYKNTKNNSSIRNMKLFVHPLWLSRCPQALHRLTSSSSFSI